MTNPNCPFPLPQSLSSDLGKVHSYWQGLIRGQASEMPYWDDVKLADLPALEDRLMLVTAFAQPERFRFEIVGKEITARYGHEIASRFADDIDINPPLDFFRAQASATIECRAPTYCKAGKYERLLLPLWGEGHIGVLLGIVA
ncbi:MAG: hypothetical protein CVT83_05475 [Alphaproteobacteria bacterium HGW-Alphaproteobacteria-5]|nr:MAG: hypothetical protein CVT83_05475 [Alphaproteobacteria bacterium HGW-Alphaproteobacteria-5]